MKTWDIHTQEGYIKVGVEFFKKLPDYEIIDLGDTLFIKGKQIVMFSMETTEWNEVQQEIRDNTINNLLDGR